MRDPSGAGTEAAYDAIAETWARTRSGPWPEVVAFLGRLPRGAQLLDIGGGSGRYTAAFAEGGLRVVSVDFSRAQLQVARRGDGGGRLIRGDARALPLREACADAGLLVAVVHHMGERRDRVQAAAEARRVLRPGGRAFLSAWASEAAVFEKAERAPGGGPRDYFVPFKAEGPPFVDRFFHAFEPGEPENQRAN